MTLIDDIRVKVTADQFEFSRHVVDRATLRHISVSEIREAITRGELIEDYPNDKYGPSCLILGLTKKGRPLHIHCSYPSRPLIKIITVYEPTTDVWIEYKIRRK